MTQENLPALSQAINYVSNHSIMKQETCTMIMADKLLILMNADETNSICSFNNLRQESYLSDVMDNIKQIMSSRENCSRFIQIVIQTTLNHDKEYVTTYGTNSPMLNWEISLKIPKNTGTYQIYKYLIL